MEPFFSVGKRQPINISEFYSAYARGIKTEELELKMQGEDSLQFEIRWSEKVALEKRVECSDNSQEQPAHLVQRP
jgi:hypothetical protein